MSLQENIDKERAIYDRIYKNLKAKGFNSKDIDKIIDHIDETVASISVKLVKEPKILKETSFEKIKKELESELDLSFYKLNENLDQKLPSKFEWNISENFISRTLNEKSRPSLSSISFPDIVQKMACQHLNKSSEDIMLKDIKSFDILRLHYKYIGDVNRHSNLNFDKQIENKMYMQRYNRRKALANALSSLSVPSFPLWSKPEDERGVLGIEDGVIVPDKKMGSGYQMYKANDVSLWNAYCAAGTLAANLVNCGAGRSPQHTSSTLLYFNDLIEKETGLPGCDWGKVQGTEVGFSFFSHSIYSGHDSRIGYSKPFVSFPDSAIFRQLDSYYDFDKKYIHKGHLL